MAVAALLSGVSAVQIKREPLLTWAPSAKAGGYPKDYFVPHFGEDHDISSTKKNVPMLKKNTAMSSTPQDHQILHQETTSCHTLVRTPTSSSPRRVADAEAKLGHVLDASGPPDPPPRDYFVPHFGEDTDIKSTKKNVADAEAKFGHVLDTSGPPDPPPRDYFVPHFGTDEDIKSSLKNLGD